MPGAAAPRPPIHGRGRCAAPCRPFMLERPHARRGTCACPRSRRPRQGGSAGAGGVLLSMSWPLSPLRGLDAQFVHGTRSVLLTIPAHSTLGFTST